MQKHPGGVKKVFDISREPVQGTSLWKKVPIMQLILCNFEKTK